MTHANERAAVSNPFIIYAEDARATYLGPDEALKLRRGITSQLSIRSSSPIFRS